MSDAATFYGPAYNSAPVPSELDAAYKWLMNAIRYEAEGDTGKNKAEMAFKTAVKKERAGFELPAND